MITNPTNQKVTGYAGEVTNVTVRVDNTSGAGGYVTVKLSGTDITVNPQTVAVRVQVLLLVLLVPSKDVNDLKLDVTASTSMN